MGANERGGYDLVSQANDSISVHEQISYCSKMSVEDSIIVIFNSSRNDDVIMSGIEVCEKCGFLN